MKPIDFEGTETLSFRQIDAVNGFAKGTAFRLFKRWRSELTEGCDYYYLPASSHGAFIESLKAEGKVYTRTIHLVLITRSGYECMQRLRPSDSAD
ncbi:MAG: hypothetical protein KGY54_12315 [Oleiphilaceae bacterium]|nr:hypothetical protein [Oleiphilaceae bacterium]